MLSGEHGLNISQHLFCFNLGEIHNTKKKDKNRGIKMLKNIISCGVLFIALTGCVYSPYDDYNHYYHGFGWTGYAPFPLEDHRPPPNGHGGGHPGGNILIISIREEGSLVEVGCIQGVVIQVVVEFILAGVGYIQVEVLGYILAVVGIVSHVK